MKQICLVTGAVLILTTSIYPALAGSMPASDEAEGVDCFYAENADNALCRPVPSANIAPPQADPDTFAPGADNNVRTVDCFFAVNREDPLCRPAAAPEAALLKRLR